MQNNIIDVYIMPMFTLGVKNQQLNSGKLLFFISINV